MSARGAHSMLKSAMDESSSSREGETTVKEDPGGGVYARIPYTKDQSAAPTKGRCLLWG